MRSFKDRSIQSKLTSIIMLTSCIALLLACAAFVGSEVFTFRSNLVSEISTLAEITGKNCAAAVSFNMPADAEKTLANLSGESQLMAACIYREGKIWARYPQTLKDDAFPAAPATASHSFAREADTIWLREQIRAALDG